MKKINWQYTFAEILIVIIGITIAFSLSKFAEDSKNKAQKLQYLTSLKNDIEADKTQLEKNTKEIEKKITLIGEILPLLNTDSQQKMSAIGKIFAIASLSNFDAKNITYQTLINSGDLKLIKDFKVKTAIETHYSNYNLMRKAYQRQENIHKEYLGNYFIHNADYDAMQNGNFGFENEKLLKNIIQSIRGSLIIKLEATKKGMESCDNILVVLQHKD